MRKLLLSLLLIGLATPAVAEDRFGADNPTFQQFEQTCRAGTTMKAECKGSVLGAFASKEKTKPGKVSCDFAAFWRVKDAQHGSRIDDVLPWQYGVEFIVAEPGVCKVI